MMKKYMKKILIALLLTGITVSLPALSIDKLKDDPERYQGDTVRLRGDVTFRAGIPFTDLLVYVLDDGSGSVLVFSAFDKQKGERASIRAEVIAYVGEENEKGRQEIIGKISDYLVEKDILDRDKAVKVSEISLKFINTIADAATGVWFVIEQEKSGLFNL